MTKQEFSVVIDAPKEKVWQVLWDKDTYPLWTAPFAEGSSVETDNWKKGSKVLFLDGKGMGMVSTVAENIPNEFMSFKHLGMVDKGVEDLDSEKVKGWAGALENYTLREENGRTSVTVEMEIGEDHLKYFVDTWPKALQKVKELSEQK
ncbi:MAG: ATPase [Chitinophagaceae bacterium]|jgi:uncharacterized protein YndB with AHSA1/START domain|nr:ATPase [Chitinophagaceae bacterium]